MTLEQILIGISILGAVLALLPKIVSFGLGGKFNLLDSKIEVMSTRIEERYISNAEKLETIHSEVKRLRDARHDFVGMVQRHEGLLKSMPSEMDRIEVKVDRLEVEVDKIKGKVEQVLDKVGKLEQRS